MTSRRVLPGWLLFVLLVGMPLLELFVLIQVGQVIGAAWTIVGLIAAGLVGSWLLRREGARAWASFQGALAEGKVPTREIADGALVMLAGAMMLAPGFVSDAFALLLILPVTRPIFRSILGRVIASKIQVAPAGVGGPFGAGFGGGFGPGFGSISGDAFGPGFGAAPGAAGGNARRPGDEDQGPVIRGVVVDD